MKAAFILSALGLISVVLAAPQPQLPGATAVPVSPASGAQVVRTRSPYISHDPFSR